MAAGMATLRSAPSTASTNVHKREEIDVPVEAAYIKNVRILVSSL
jgi:hypothetical protein